MGLFKHIFGNGDGNPANSQIDWKPLSSLPQLDEISNESSQKTVLIFKHSTRCGVSRMVLRSFENEFGLQDQMTTYFLDLLQHRNISNEIAHRFDVPHQSPQILVIKDGKAVYNASHDGIDAEKLKEFIG